MSIGAFFGRTVRKSQPSISYSLGTNASAFINFKQATLMTDSWHGNTSNRSFDHICDQSCIMAALRNIVAQSVRGLLCKRLRHSISKIDCGLSC